MSTTTYRKNEQKDDLDLKYSGALSKPDKRKGKNKNKSQGAGAAVSSQDLATTEPSHHQQQQPQSSGSNPVPKKGATKFVPLYSDEGHDRSVVRLPGRHPCTCQAVRHRLVSNCLGCGRIVCDQEGSGPCFFCGELVYTHEEERILRRGGKEATKLKAKLLGGFLDGSGDEAASEGVGDVFNLAQISAELEKAIDAKNMLLEFDQTSERRTTVIDDQSDYFAVNSQWLTDEERAKLRNHYDALRKKRFAPRNQQTYTLDFAGRKVTADSTNVNMYSGGDEVLKQLPGSSDGDNNMAPDEDEWTDLSVHPSATLRPEYLTADVSHDGATSSYAAAVTTDETTGTTASRSRIQDGSLTEMADDGWALSMHQPYASLLVAGIKRHEGRSWYSPHRGRLWIAAAAKEPSAEEIHELEHYYTALNRGKEPYNFPQHYPTGCLLGCVDVVNCMPQEQYLEEFPDGESSSPYVFICRNPQELLIRFPIQGKHKLYKLDPHIHQAAKKSIIQMAVMKKKADPA